MVRRQHRNNNYCLHQKMHIPTAHENTHYQKHTSSRRFHSGAFCARFQLPKLRHKLVTQPLYVALSPINDTHYRTVLFINSKPCSSYALVRLCCASSVPRHKPPICMHPCFRKSLQLGFAAHEGFLKHSMYIEQQRYREQQIALTWRN